MPSTATLMRGAAASSGRPYAVPIVMPCHRIAPGSTSSNGVRTSIAAFQSLTVESMRGSCLYIDRNSARVGGAGSPSWRREP